MGFSGADNLIQSDKEIINDYGFVGDVKSQHSLSTLLNSGIIPVFVQLHDKTDNY
jgi:acetylglutamate kinase